MLRHTRSRAATLWSLVVMAGIAALLQYPVAAQTTSPALNGQLTPSPLPAATPSVLDVPAQPTANAASPVTAGSVATDRSSSVGKFFGSAGRGLPGMPGGPAVNSTLGSQDPSGQYMRPQTLPPVLCDPAVDMPC